MATPELFTLTLDAAPAAEGAADVAVTIQPRSGTPATRRPVDVVCVLDVSGSMGCTVSVQNDQGAGEDDGLTRANPPTTPRAPAAGGGV